jgi:hypothetical protein
MTRRVCFSNRVRAGLAARPARQNDLCYLPATYDNELVACNRLIVEKEQQDRS